MNLLDIGERFAEERLRLGYTQVAFARLLGLSRVALGNIEAGKSEFKVNALSSAASIGVDVQYVLTGVRSENVKKVSEEIGLGNQVINGNISGVGFAQTGANVQIVNTIKHTSKTKAETKPGVDHITLEQRSILQTLVDEVVEKEQKLKKTPKTHRAVWASLNKHCKVNTYHLIALRDFDKARSYLNMWIARLNAAPSAAIKDGDAWRRKRISYIKVNTKEADDEAAYRAYIKRKYGVESTADLSNDQLEESYRYVAGRRNKKK